MPLTVKQVKGHEYLYFSYYDRENRRKKEVYLGPKTSSQAVEKALLYSKEFLDMQQSKINAGYVQVEKFLQKIGAVRRPPRSSVPNRP